ncbi:HesB/IscA family protein [Nonomuraea africana]|uniref:Fe-S cluster assembly iron-binding protein IscA n=1 Tax=Nonomuraea africana TaxID=46171 RepID=A0ABR9KBR1_9ACTN|nr:iron-sulfur cluster biosynthesis family protein [Nonomuraea africana]MBE1559442.1 Fe-S cluster assembly iron-binding protein IscA [Nonomuraea africana]
MLTLTPNAAQVIKDLTAQQDVEAAGIRISAQGEGQGSLVLSMATAPEPTDEVVETEGARVYLDPVAASVLDDKSLDADTDGQGGVAFHVTE